MKFEFDSAAAVIAKLQLQELPGEGGYWAPGVRTESMNSIYFLMTNSNSGFSALHRLQVTEGWQWLAGAPAKMIQIGSSGALNSISLNPDSTQTIVPSGVWQAAATEGEWTLVSCWCAPAFSEEIFELGKQSELLAEFPQHAAAILEFSR